MPRALVTVADATPPIELEYDTFGEAADPAVLLIMGTGMSLVAWDEDICEALAAEGYFVVRYDHRDIGRSTKVAFADDPAEVIVAAVLGGPQKPPYTAVDMAGDAVGLLDHLGIGRAHLVGVSLGGIIAQWVAILHPDRVATLTAIMSTTGEPSVGQPDPAVLPALLAESEPGLDGAVANSVQLRRALAGDHFVEDDVRRAAIRAWQHAEGPQNRAHHLAAGLHTPSRADRLVDVTAPTLVIHGGADRLVDPSGGRRVAELVPGARLMLVQGMGHDLPAPNRPAVIDAVIAHTRSHPAAAAVPLDA